MILKKSNLVILTLDAGGTNFVFTAIKANKEMGAPIILDAQPDSMESCTHCIIQGFELLMQGINEPIAAISFAFPGPADYKLGIIGNLPNFPGINGDFPLKNILETHFNLPVFINNDGDLFTYGEALTGVLPAINENLKTYGSKKEFRNLIGITLGTGIGNGIVINGILLQGDNSCAAEIHNMSNPNNPNWNIEESVSTRAVQRIYSEVSGLKQSPLLLPKDIYAIAKGQRQGDKEAAITAFTYYGEALGYAISNLLTLIDGLVVLGGGITAAWDLFSPSMFKILGTPYQKANGTKNQRTSISIFDLEDQDSFKTFLKGKTVKIKWDAKSVDFLYDKMPRTGVILSKNGASKSTSLGAYHFAIAELEKM